MPKQDNFHIMHKVPLSILSVLYFLLISPISAQNINTEIGIEEHLGEFIPTHVKLYNENDSVVVLKDILDKPTVLNFVYFRCPGICTPLMNGLADVIDRSDLMPGKDYQVITISFDPTETPDVALKKKKNYMKLIRNYNVQNGWFFFTADSQVIDTLTKAAGFKYKKTGNEYLHAGTIIMISPQGKISRYLNGITFLPLEFKLGLIEAAEGKTGATINKVLQYCFSYDPASHKYVLSITRVAGVILSAFALLLLLVLVLKPVFRKNKNK